MHLLRVGTAVLASGGFLLAMAAVTPAQTVATQPPTVLANNGENLKALNAVAGAAMLQATPYMDLELLSDTVGERMTGTPQAAKGIAWGVAKMKAIGLENVHTESWPLWEGWRRISASARLVSPEARPLMVDAMGWVGSTPAGGVTAEVVSVNTYQLPKEVRDNAGNWRGKVLLLEAEGTPPPRSQMLAAFENFGKFLQAAHAAGAVAVIGGQGGAASQGMHLTHTGILGFAESFQIPVISMAAGDQDELERDLARGTTPRIFLNVQNKFVPGPVTSHNVVGEIRGSEYPNQIVVVGGHFDSWDLAQGATDNGAGTSTALGAAEAILASGYRPKRTIQFVLYTGEEQGLLGSFAYVKRHQADIANYVAAINLDNGQGPVVNLSAGRPDVVPALKPLAAALGAFGKIGVSAGVSFDTDVGPYSLAGLPAIDLDQDSPEYRYTHHSNVDDFNFIHEDVLRRDAAVEAVVAFWIADHEPRFASPWSPQQTEQMLINQHQEQFLKAIGHWPFVGASSDPR